ncbi:MAG: hypothetical protein IIW14_05190 [Kiritimatiellae bacterium]|nr:hypothetical protein [Kiritimatiellia bacterium]
MIVKTFLACAFAAVTFFAAANDFIFRCDFASKVREVNAKAVGEMSGVLPVGCAENFAAWKDARVRTRRMKEDGVEFIRFETAAESSGQFAFMNLNVEFPGCYIFRVRSRQLTAPSLSFSIRENGEPYRGFWTDNVMSPEWCEREYIIRLPKTEAGRCGLFFYTSKGMIDIASFELKRFDEEEYRRSIRRPATGETRLMRRHRFPLSLPSGWTIRCDKGVEALVSGVKTSDALDALAVGEGGFTLYSEPFQTNRPEEDHIARFDYRLTSPRALEMAVLDDAGKVVASAPLKPRGDWGRGELRFKAPVDSIAFTLRFTGEGMFALDRIDVSPADAGERAADEPSVTRAALKGEIAALSRIQFSDEPAVLTAAVVDAKKGSRLVVRVSDIYGRSKNLKPIMLGGGKLQRLEIPYGVFDDVESGQFRVQALVAHEGKRVSAIEEFVVTRLKRPPAFGKDAPLSPFGAHFEPQPEILAMMKAGGVNWMRIHDAASGLSGWWELEPERGKWRWPDGQIARIRKAGVSIFAQLGTAPAWATNYEKLGCKRMGYFEKYLRPVDMAAWTNYVERYVSRYRDEIDEYFIWNEPWGDWWAAAKDLKLFNPDRAPEDFGEFSKITYAAVKRVKPSALVSGYNTYSSNGGSDWSARVDSVGAYDACDMMDFHIYSPSPRLFPDEESLSARAFKPVTDAHPGKSKPIYMSEGQGASAGNSGGNSLRMSGLYSAAVPWKAATGADCASFSDRTVRYVISLLTEANLKRVFLYSTHGYRALGTKPSYLTLLAADGFAHPSLVAHAQMARALEGRRFISRSKFARNALKVEFSGGCTVYSGLSLEEAADVSKRCELIDLYGNRFDRERFFPGTVCYSFE